MDKTSLGDRMKKNYEQRSKTKLTRRMPVILRLDGVAFHTYTKGMDRPFDEALMFFMAETTQKLCEKIQGATFAYQQSDEISILLKDYNKITSDAWFDYNVQKMCSVAASMATRLFSDLINHYLYDESFDQFISFWEFPKEGISKEEIKERYKRFKREAFFDCRAFNIPKEEVTNYFIWRQQDATRNSIQMVGQSNFSSKELHGKSCNVIQDMLFKEKGINWNDLSNDKKRGISVYREKQEERSGFITNHHIPIFTQDRKFIEKWLEPEKE